VIAEVGPVSDGLTIENDGVTSALQPAERDEIARVFEG
jgi:hypothetical protein